MRSIRESSASPVRALVDDGAKFDAGRDPIGALSHPATAQKRRRARQVRLVFMSASNLADGWPASTATDLPPQTRCAGLRVARAAPEMAAGAPAHGSARCPPLRRHNSHPVRHSAAPLPNVPELFRQQFDSGGQLRVEGLIQVVRLFFLGL